MTLCLPVKTNLPSLEIVGGVKLVADSPAFDGADGLGLTKDGEVLFKLHKLKTEQEVDA